MHVDALSGVVARGVDLEALGGALQEGLGRRPARIGDPRLAPLPDQHGQQRSSGCTLRAS